MRLLLDTHVWLWMHGAPERLTKKARRVLEDPARELVFSAASAWEISIKHALGKLSLPELPQKYVPRRVSDDGLVVMPVHLEHALKAGHLPLYHRDPFDRLLVAQALVEKLPLMTADGSFAPYAKEGLKLARA